MAVCVQEERRQKEWQKHEEELEQHRRNLELDEIEEAQFQSYARDVIQHCEQRGRNTYPLRRAAANGSRQVIRQESRAVARKPHDAAAVLFDLKFAHTAFTTSLRVVKQGRSQEFATKGAGSRGRAQVGSRGEAPRSQRQMLISSYDGGTCTHVPLAPWLRHCSQASKARLQSSKHIGANQNLTPNGHSKSFKVTCLESVEIR